MKYRQPSSNPGILLFVVMMTTIIFFIPTYLIQQHIRDLIIGELGHDATSTAIAIARFLERDLDAYRRFHDIDTYESGSYDSVWYQEVRSVLAQIKQETGADFIFTEKWIDGNNIAYLLDAEEPGSDLYSPPGSLDGMSDPERQAFLGSVATNSGMIRDPEWGNYLTGFAPILDKEKDRVLGLVGVDYSMDHVKDLIFHVGRSTWGGMAMMVILASVVILRLLDMRHNALEVDYLTGLYSKHYHDKQMERLGKVAAHTGVSYCHAIMDIDNFKDVNDRYSHQDGDDVLREVAKLLQKNVRSTDTCARLGGDEFGLLFPDTNKEQVEAILERIRVKASLTTLRTGEGSEINVTLSIGFVMWEKGTDKEQMESRADMAMYQSKNNGKNRVTCWAS